MKEQIIEILKKNGEMTLKDLFKAMHLKTDVQRKELNVALNELEDEREIYNDHEHYVLIDNKHYMTGRARDISSSEYAIMNKDLKVYVPKNSARILLDKDEVLVRLDRRGNEVVHVYQRGIVCIAGTFVRVGNRLKFRSDVDLHTSFDVTNMKDFNVTAGMKAVVKVIDYTSPLRVKIVELLGKEDEPGVDISCILAENEVRQDFGKKVKKELEEIPDRVHKKEIKDRRDLRGLMTVTIDGDSTKDFDDAVSIVKKEDGGWKLYVHIADVSHYVEEGEAIDEEAYKRGTSIYVCDRVVPMLPFKLSNGICSLNPEVDRLTLTCEMDFSPEGLMTGCDIYESVIHSDARTTYSKVNSYLEDENSVPEYAEIGPMLRDFSDLAKKLKEQTGKRGHIEFETREPYFVLDEKGNPVDVKIRERGWSEQMIEEAMVAANVAVAHALHSQSLPGMYRVHEVPDPEKLATLVNMAKVLNVPCDIDPENCEPMDIARFLESIEDPRAKEILAAVAVRSMQKARYSENNLGHYGLALDEYCHFTSPIRRYPDLLIHRMLRRHIIDKKNDEKTIRKDQKRMEKSALHLSEKERDAVMLERAVDDLESAKYMENKVGMEYDGVITGVASFGFFVELDNTIEGMIPLRNMEDDFYKYEPDTMMLTGENTGRTFKLGRPVHIKVRDVNVPKRQVTFDLLDAPELPAPEKAEDFPAVIEPENQPEPKEEAAQAEPEGKADHKPVEKPEDKSEDTAASEPKEEQTEVKDLTQEPVHT